MDNSIAPTSLPSWLQVGGRCRWWSESQQTHHPVVVTAVDEVKRRVVVHFAANHSVWKAVPFSQIGNGPLRPEEAEGKPKGLPEEARKLDGRATPPWYEQLNKAETRQEAVQEVRRKEESHVATQEKRRYLWQQEQQRKAEEEHRRREEERQAREAAAECERLRILEKLKKEREEEQLRQFEVLLMNKEDEVSTNVNALWRQREDVARRQKEEEERQRFEEEQVLLARKLEEERASRPRIAFGVKTRQDPVKASNPPPIKIPEPRPVQEPEMSTSWDSWDTWNEPVQPTGSAFPVAPFSERDPQVQAQATHGNQWQNLHPHQLHQVHQLHQPEEKAHVPTNSGRFRSLKEWYGQQIRSVYQKYNPEKLADVPHLMQKYSGCEDEMYDRICEKYGVQPAIPPQNLGRLPPPPPLPQQAESKDFKAIGFARKASAPAPIPQVSHESRSRLQGDGDAPSTSDLMTRFQNLVRDMPPPLDEKAEPAHLEQVRQVRQRRSENAPQLSRSPRRHPNEGAPTMSDGPGSSGSFGTVAAPIGGRRRPPLPSSAKDLYKDTRGPAPSKSSQLPDRYREVGAAPAERPIDPPIGMRHNQRSDSRGRDRIAAPQQRGPLPIGAPLHGSVGRSYRDRAVKEVRARDSGVRSRSPSYRRNREPASNVSNGVNMVNRARSDGRWTR